MTTTFESVIAVSEIRKREIYAVELVWSTLFTFPVPLYQVNSWLDSFPFALVLDGVRKAAKRSARADGKSQVDAYLINYAEMSMLAKLKRGESLPAPMCAAISRSFFKFALS